MSAGISSGFCNAGHWSMGLGGKVVEIVCKGCVFVRLHVSPWGDGGVCGGSSVASVLEVRSRLAARCSRALG